MRIAGHRSKCHGILLVVVAVLSSLHAQHQGEEQRPRTRLSGEQLLRETSKGGDRGKPGILKTSESVLILYPDLKPKFESAAAAVAAARRTIDRYQKKGPKTAAQWSEYLHAHQEMQAARETYQEALRETIAARRGVVERVHEEGRIQSVADEYASEVRRQTRQLKAIGDVQSQLDRQQNEIVGGRTPTINWPADLSPEHRQEIERVIASAVNTRGIDVSAGERLKERVGKLRRELQENAQELRNAAMHNAEQLSDLEMELIAELAGLADAQVDLARNAMMQQNTIKEAYFVQRTYQIWKDLR